MKTQAIAEQRPSFTPTGTILLQSKCDKCPKKHLLQMGHNNQVGSMSAPSIDYKVQNSPNQTLAPGNRIQSHVGHSLSQIFIYAPSPDAAAKMQTKLAISQPGDEYEQEADRVAEQVMRMPEVIVQSQPLISRDEQGVRGMCPRCKEDEKENLQTKTITRQASGTPRGLDAPPIVHEVLRSPGQKLNAATRTFMEPRFGHDFSKVRVHTDTRAEESARAVNALAYTVGEDVAFGRGHYAPDTANGMRLLAHELTHYLQQQHSENRALPDKSPERARNAADESLFSRSPIWVSRSTVTRGLLARQSAKGCANSQQTIHRVAVGTNGMFPVSSKTEAIRLWDYVVYSDHVRLGNRKVSDGVVIGSWPWLTNNPGDITVDVRPRMQKKDDPTSGYWQNARAWGWPAKQGPSPDKLSPVSGDSGLSVDNTAVEGFAARGDLAIFADLERGQRALKEWILKYFGDKTLRVYVSTIHLGPVGTHKKGDDPEKYWKRMQLYLSDKKYPQNYVTMTKGKDVKENEWGDVLDAFGFVEGFFSRRDVAGQANKFQYVENKGIIYRCGGRDPIGVDPAFKNHEYVKKMPQNTPPEIKWLLGCVDESSSDSCPQDQPEDQSSSPAESQGGSEDTGSINAGGAGGAPDRSNESGGSEGSSGGK